MMHDRPGDVVTISKRGQWVNRVEGDEELSQGYATKEEAIEAGRRLAEASGTRHRIVDAEPTGAVTDESGAPGANADEEDADDDVIEVKDLP